MNIDPSLEGIYILASQIANRSVTEEAACTSVREASHPDFPMSTLRNCAQLAVDLVERDPDHAYYFCWLTLAMTETKWGRDRESPWWVTADLFVEITRRSLSTRPAAARLKEALRTADLQIEILERKIAQLKAHGGLLLKRRRAAIAAESLELAETLRGAGWLLVGPYWEVLDPDDLVGSIRQWLEPFELRRLTYWVRGEWNGDQDVAMPDPKLAVTSGLGYLNAALWEAPPEARGVCQIARAAALSLLALLDPERENEHWVSAADAAREAEASPTAKLRNEFFFEVTASVVRRIGLQEPLSLKALLGVPIQELRRQVPGPLLVRLLSDVATFVENPDDLREIWVAVHAVLAEGGELPIAPRVWTYLAHRIPGDRMRCIKAPVGFAELTATVEEVCSQAGVSAGERAATLVHAMLHVCPEDVEHAVLLLDSIHEVDRDFRTTYAWMLDYLVLDYRKRYAARLADAGKFHEALLEYLMVCEISWQFAVRHCRPALGADLVKRALAALSASEGDESFDFSVLVFLKIVEPVVTGMLSIMGTLDGRVEFVHSLGQYLARFLVLANSEGPMIADHHLLFKGFDFRLMAQNPGPHPRPSSVDKFNEMINAQEVKTGTHMPNLPKIFLNDMESVPGGISELFFISSREIAPGRGAETSVETLRRIADQEITNSLILKTCQDKTAKITRPALAEMRDQMAVSLSDEIVVISLYLSEHDCSNDNDQALVGTLASLISCQVTARVITVQIANLSIPGGYYMFRRQDTEYRMHWAALSVAEVREEINVDPLGSPVTLRGAQVLGEYFLRLGGPVPDQLRRWRSEGKNHLCFWPHGPLHYVPFHLLHLDGRPLADDWIVTTVASSAHLLPSVRTASRRHRLLVLSAPSGGVKYGLPEQPQVAEHVRNLATRVPDARLLEADATPRVAMMAIRDVDYLHIAAHGSQDVEASWYHCLYLNPDEDDGDGRLFAHQILGLDLRGLELVTLSACESALGRYDLNDNLRGLPAAFLLAGAATVIGALWPVTAAVATLFFEELYSCLLNGHPKRDAFHRAQRVTRQAYPEYRDWGAFTFIGDWR